MRASERFFDQDGVKFVGTLQDISPEQLQSNLLEVDERTDVYGLGATLYEMATLAPIFDGDNPNRLVEQVLHQEPKSLRAIEPEIPKDLSAIALHCLDKDRATASFDKTARVWDAGSGAELLTLKGHSGFVESVAWSPDGSRIATASDDTMVRIWDSRTGAERVAADRSFVIITTRQMTS